MASSRHLVDPELSPLIDAMPQRSLSPALLVKLRNLPFPLPPAPPEMIAAVAMETRLCKGPDGAPEVGLVTYRPKKASSRLGCILHLHGGGYIMGSAAQMEPYHRRLAYMLGCAIVSVDYRLAPETRFPGAIEDCYAALRWLFASADELNVDTRRIGVMGQSAGGGLAAALALLVRDRKEYALAFQHLIYPMLDDRTVTAARKNPFSGEFFWTAESNRFGWSALLGHEPGGTDVSPYAAATRAEDLSGLPPTFLSTGALDLFVDENLTYAQRLTHAGVPTELHMYPGAFHGFDILADSSVSRRARDESAEALRRALA